MAAAHVVGYARCALADRDATAQRNRLRELGVSEDLIYLDRGMTGAMRERPRLDQVLAAVREGDTLVAPSLGRLARSVVEAHSIGDLVAERKVVLRLGENEFDRPILSVTCSFGRWAPSPTSRARCSGCGPARAWR